MSCIRDLEELGLIKVERTTGCLNEYLFTPDQYREKGLVPNEGSTLKGDGTSTTKRDGLVPRKVTGLVPLNGALLKKHLKKHLKKTLKRETRKKIQLIRY